MSNDIIPDDWGGSSQRAVNPAGFSGSRSDENGASLANSLLRAATVSSEAALFAPPSTDERANFSKAGHSSLDPIVKKEAVVPEIRGDYDPEPRCASCSTKNVTITRVCENCGKSDGLTFGKTLIHLVCHHIDQESTFRKDILGVSCPKCSRPTISHGPEFVSLGSLYKCAYCHAFGDRAKLVFTCRECGSVSEAESSGNLSVEAFVARQGRAMTANSSYSTDPRPLLKKLQLAGWSIESRGADSSSFSSKGKSGILNRFSILASRGTMNSVRSKKDVLAIDVASDDLGVEITRVHSFFARALDCGIGKRIVVAIPRLEESARKLADAFNIKYIEAPDTTLASEALERALQSLGPAEGVAANKGLPSFSKKRSPVDIMADILKVTQVPSSKTEIMACANLSFAQCKKYLPRLERVELLRRTLEDGVHARYQITEKGLGYLSDLFREYGDITDGEKSVWNSRRKGKRSGQVFSSKDTGSVGGVFTSAERLA